MTTPARLLVREIRHRPWGFALTALAVAAACACLLAVVALVRGQQRQAANSLAELRRQSQERMDRLEDESRNFAKRLGFNIILLPPGQDAGAWQLQQPSTAFFTPGQVATLGEARLNYLNHVLPILQHRAVWPEAGGEAVFVGTPGQVFMQNPRQEPLQRPIVLGTIVLGAGLARRLGAESGAEVVLHDRRLRVALVQPATGGREDQQALLHIEELRQLFRLPDHYSALLALSCNCAAGDLAPIQRETGALVPGIQVIEATTLAKARSEARRVAGETAEATIRTLRETSSALGEVLARGGLLLTGAVASAAALAVAALALVNARERRSELAILRAIGTPTHLMLLFILARAGLAALLGVTLGLLAGAALTGWLLPGQEALLDDGVRLLTAGGAVATALLCALVPALLAVAEDPARVLNQES
jgi:hypothetical protein